MSVPSFSDFLEAKPLYYKEIDHQRVHQAYAVLRETIAHPPNIHIVGTNGKGSTGRIIAHLAYRSGLGTGHFSSPHILKFNERIWLNGRDSSDEKLEAAHQRLYRILGQQMSEALSYFEYTTLLALIVFEDLDLIILEAGLGGEYDATNVCDKILSVITPIGIDHQAFLGETIEEIASTKIRSIRKQALLAPQVYSEVVEVAKRIALERRAELLLSVERSVLSVKKRGELEQIVQEKGWGKYLIDNVMVALQTLDILNIRYDINDLGSLELFGRFYPLRHNIRIDVGHNPLAAKAIVEALDDEVVLIYNSLDDKDYEEVLRILKPRVKRVEIIRIVSQRAATLEQIEEALQNAELQYHYFDGTINEEVNYLVFGSFYVVEAFLKKLKVKN